MSTNELHQAYVEAELFKNQKADSELLRDLLRKLEDFGDVSGMFRLTFLCLLL